MLALPNFKMPRTTYCHVASRVSTTCFGSGSILPGLQVWSSRMWVPQWYGIYIDIPWYINIRITSYTFMYHDIMINTNIYTNMYIYYIYYIYNILIIWYDLSFPYGLAIRSLCRGRPCSGHDVSPRYPFPGGARRQGWGAVALSGQW